MSTFSSAFAVSTQEEASIINVTSIFYASYTISAIDRSNIVGDYPVFSFLSVEGMPLLFTSSFAISTYEHSSIEEHVFTSYTSFSTSFFEESIIELTATPIFMQSTYSISTIEESSILTTTIQSSFNLYTSEYADVSCARYTASYNISCYEHSIIIPSNMYVSSYSVTTLDQLSIETSNIIAKFKLDTFESLELPAPPLTNTILNLIPMIILILIVILILTIISII